MRFAIIFTLWMIGVLAKANNPYTNFNSSDFFKLPAFNAPIDLAKVDAELIEAGVFYLTNIYRAKKNNSLLSYDESLSHAAYLHSEQMQLYNFFDHVNKRNKSLSTLDKRAVYVGYGDYTTLAENIYYGSINTNQPESYKDVCLEIVNAFISSKGHRENLLARDVKDLGCGIFFDGKITNGYWYYNFTQDFGKKLS